MGWAFVKRRMMAELGAGLAGEIRRVRAQAGGGGLARPGASRALARRQAARLQAAISRHAVGGRSRSAAARLAVRDPPPHGSGDRHHARSPRRSARACARSSTTSARPSTSRSIARCSAAADLVRVPDVWPELSTGRLLTLDWLEGTQAARAQEGAARRCATASATAMFTAWWFPFSRFGVIHGDPHLGNYTVFERRRRARRHQSARLWLHPHLPAELRRRRGRSLSRAAATATTSCVVHAYETWGFKGLSRETDRHPQHLGAASSTARCWTTACAPSPTA